MKIGINVVYLHDVISLEFRVESLEAVIKFRVES